MYHYLGDPAPDDPHRGLWVPVAEFREHLALLRAMGRRTVLGPEYAAGLGTAALRDAVWLTFDDGRIDNFGVALPALKAAGARATFFAIAERSLGGAKDYIPLSGLREMVAEGMEIGSHTLTHPKLPRLAPEQLREEIVGSKKRLEDALGVAVTSFCYPYGSWNAAARDLVREAGYTAAASTIRDNRNDAADRFALRRVMVQPGRRGLGFRYLFSPLYHWIHGYKNRRRWKKAIADGGSV